MGHSFYCIHSINTIFKNTVMIHNDPNNRSRTNDMENRREDENEPLRTNEANENVSNEVPDLDGDGFIGNTGGFYGGTSYLGSNYSESWGTGRGSAPENEGNFGAAGHKDSRSEDERTEDSTDDRTL